MIVLDTSAALAKTLMSQATTAADSFFAGVLPILIAPGIFAFELRNALLRAERRRMTASDLVDRALAEFSELVELRPWTAADLGRLTALARQEALSFFDAAYLDLAESEGAALASRDRRLLEAAVRRGIPVHDLR